MKRLLALVLSATMILTACGGSTTEGGETPKGDNLVTYPNGEVKERQEFSKIYSAEMSTFNYLTSSLSTSTQLNYLIIDGLVEFDEYGVLQPCLATDWTISEDKMTYTFKLREGVKWYTYDGTEYADLVAQDFVDGMKYVLTQENASKTSNIVYNVVAGAKDYYDGVTTDFSTVGIKAIDEHTLEYTLIEPTPYFLKMISYSCWLPANGKFVEEAGERFGTSNDKILYNGAYTITTHEPENRRVLTMNENYWDKENIYISKINYQFNKEAAALGPEMFLRGETDEISLPLGIVDEWMNDPVKKNQIHKKPMTSYSYFYAFNFEPQYEEEFAPGDWTIAVDNKNFRKSLFHAVDRVAALTTVDPYNAENRTNNTLTKPEFLYYEGVDYVDFPALAEITSTDTFNPDLALEFKAAALKELEGKVKFPLQVVMPYNTGKQDLSSRVQVVEQQMEKLLGIDYIDIKLVPYPASGYNKASRSSGKFSMLEVNWGPDYADPASYHDVMSATTTIGQVFHKPWLATGNAGLGTDGMSKYDSMMAVAVAETVDLEKRYQLLAEAEAFLIDEALMLPFYISGGGFMANKLDPFSGNCTQFGRNADNLKGKVVMETSMGLDEYLAKEIEFNQARDAALKAQDD